MQGVHRTRQNFKSMEECLVNRGLLEVSNARLDMTKTSWRWRAAEQYNTLPHAMKQLDIKEFKVQLKTFVKLRV